MFMQVNPPYYIKLVELVPHPDTLGAVMDTTHALMTQVHTRTNTQLTLVIHTHCSYKQ